MSVAVITPPAVRLGLDGTCNRCGLCCTMEHEGKRVVCEYLDAEVPVKPLGMPEASRCRAYEYRSPARPLHIRMLDGRGMVWLKAQCFKDTWQEDRVILERGIGQGCSLRLPVTEGRLASFTPTRRA